MKKRLLSLLLCVALVLTFAPLCALAKNAVISEIVITNADIVPVEGESPADHVGYTLPRDRHYRVEQCSWWDETNGYWYASKALEFKKGDTYQLVWNFYANEGYEFAENTTVTINGSAANVGESRYLFEDRPDTFFVKTDPVTVGEPTTPTKTEPQPTETEPKPTETEPTKTKAPTETEPKATTEPTVKPTESKPTVAPTEVTPTKEEPIVTETKPTESKATVAPTKETVAPTETEPVIDPTATATGTEAPSILLYGDANDDGVVNMKDVLAVRKYVASLPITINMLTADANADGVVNMKDVLAIRKYIAGLVDHLGA